MTLRALGIALLLVATAACGSSPSAPSAAANDPSQNLNVPFSQVDLVTGTGRVAANGNAVTVHYTGWLYNEANTDKKGAQFDTSALRGPFAFRVGAGSVIRGWDQGVVGMAVGGKRRLIIPPGLAYGSAGSGPIPANATIVFDIELLTVTD
ncbi:MAG: FKBP-type peptidyl-prolyl cis-trans isomerase [Vicinamibacterales bacterium]|nr:FKBP-type peptidyl-prolyl cis-trans isomerase [Vicinamibacterales bacterium]